MFLVPTTVAEQSLYDPCFHKCLSIVRQTAQSHLEHFQLSMSDAHTALQSSVEPSANSPYVVVLSLQYITGFN